MKKEHPTFIGIGVPKAGTTWLHYQLKQHPDIYTPVHKELHYFSRSPGKYPHLVSRLGEDSVTNRLYGNSKGAKAWRQYFESFLDSHSQNNEALDFNKLRSHFNYLFGDYSQDWYKSLFQKAGNRISGEITPAYAALNRKDIAAIKDFLPDVKIILLLRNPIDRIWSHLRSAYSRKQIRITEVPVDRLIANLGRASLNAFHYPDIIDNWRYVFDDEHFFIGYYEEVSKKPELLLNRLPNFLQLDRPNTWPRASERRHETSEKAGMPEEVECHLIRKYLDEMTRLSQSLGGYATTWYESAQKRLEVLTG